MQRLQSAAQESEALARGQDVRFALDRVLSQEAGPYGARIDRRRIVVAGHSVRRQHRAGCGRRRRDARRPAAGSEGPALLGRDPDSSPPFYGEKQLASVLENVSVPTLHVTATDDVIQIPGYYSPASDRLAIYNAIATPRKAIAVFQGGSHSMFTDRAVTGGVDLNPKVKAATAELALAFLDLVYDGDRSTMTRWNTRWQPIVALAPGAAPFLTPVARSGVALTR